MVRCGVAANTLVALSSAPSAVRAAVTAFCTLLQSESDNNVKLIILTRLQSLRAKNERILQDMLLDILRALSSPNIDIRKKTLELALDLMSARNVDAIVSLLKKELAKTDTVEGKSDAYRKLLVDTLHKCAVAHPDVVASVAQALVVYLGDDNPYAAIDVVFFLRECMESHPHLRRGLVERLMEHFDVVKTRMSLDLALAVVFAFLLPAAYLHALARSSSFYFLYSAVSFPIHDLFWCLCSTGHPHVLLATGRVRTRARSV